MTPPTAHEKRANMPTKTSKSPSSLTADQEVSREEWRNLCFTLERAQGENLVQNCRDKFQFAKTYMVYGRELEQTVAEVKQAADQGNYRFFAERGIRADHLTPELADQMMIDWRGAIASKKAVVADVFQRRFGEDIEQFVGTPHNASRLIMANRYDAKDAILGLVEWGHARPSNADLNLIGSELAQLRAQIDELRKTVQNGLAQVNQRLDRLTP
jgi:hypothetical protein